MATAAPNPSDCSLMYMMTTITSHTVWVAFPLCRVSFNKQVFNFNAECIGLFLFQLALSGSCANNLCLPQNEENTPVCFLLDTPVLPVPLRVTVCSAFF